MPAFPSHSTAVEDNAWDGDAAVAAANPDQERSYYSRIFAWFDNAGEAGSKSTYKLPHHEVNGDGEPGAANIPALIAAVAALNGARGGVDIPEDERRATWRHLAAHLEDAGREAPDLRRDPQGRERRSFTSMIEVRSESGKPVIEGHAAVFDKFSVPIFGFREVVRPGAFAGAIQNDDIRALWNHDPNFVLGRNKAGTLELREDSTGLHTRIHPPETEWAKGLVESIRRGDIDQMSFGFSVKRENWFSEDGEQRRELLEVGLFDVSPVTYAAYPQTDVGVRALSACGLDLSKMAAIAYKAGAGSELSDEERSFIVETSETMNAWTKKQISGVGSRAAETTENGGSGSRNAEGENSARKEFELWKNKERRKLDLALHS